MEKEEVFQALVQCLENEFHYLIIDEDCNRDLVFEQVPLALAYLKDNFSLSDADEHEEHTPEEAQI